MQYRRYQVILRRFPSPPELLTLQDVARQVRVHPALVERLLELGLIEPEQTSPDVLFAPQVVADVRRALRLHDDLGINWIGVGLVMDLLERVAQLESEVTRLRNR